MTAKATPLKAAQRREWARSNRAAAIAKMDIQEAAILARSYLIIYAVPISQSTVGEQNQIDSCYFSLR
jgi:hypothetical protein